MKALKKIQKIVPAIAYTFFKNETNLVFIQKQLLFALTCLKLHINYQYRLLTCISGVDYMKSTYRFGVIYDLLSLTYNSRLRLKVFVNETTPVDTAIKVYINANWWEREIWDLYGIYFKKHPDLRRILTDYGFEGYPMRKDYPLSGFVELRYDHNKKRIILEALELAQEFRSFNFETPW